MLKQPEFWESKEFRYRYLIEGVAEGVPEGVPEDEEVPWCLINQCLPEFLARGDVTLL